MEETQYWAILSFYRVFFLDFFSRKTHKSLKHQVVFVFFYWFQKKSLQRLKSAACYTPMNFPLMSGGGGAKDGDGAKSPSASSTSSLMRLASFEMNLDGGHDAATPTTVVRTRPPFLKMALGFEMEIRTKKMNFDLKKYKSKVKRRKSKLDDAATPTTVVRTRPPFIKDGA